MIDLLLLGRSPQFVLQGDGDFGLEEFSLLLGSGHIPSVPKPIGFVNFWNFDFGTILERTRRHLQRVGPSTQLRYLDQRIDHDTVEPTLQGGQRRQPLVKLVLGDAAT